MLRRKKEESEQLEKRAGAVKVYTFNDNETILSFDPHKQEQKISTKSKKSAHLFSLQQADQESTNTALWVNKQTSDEEVKHMQSQENSREASLVATPSYSPSKASIGTTAYEDFEGKNYFQFFRQSLRSSIGSKIKYNVKSNYQYVRQLNFDKKQPEEVKAAKRGL
mmetsp:Transcript_26595/g.40592  ORF Transcript_26595/g.40592 Transcript_26595/m.40592 type:complete len:166 (-) Transcript_26595:231-728(-)